MCLARVGKVIKASEGRARVEFFDGGTADGVDISMVKATRGSFVEVFANLALSKLSRSEAESRREAWAAVVRAR